MGVPVTAEPTTDKPVGKLLAEYAILLPAADAADRAWLTVSLACIVIV